MNYLIITDLDCPLKDRASYLNNTCIALQNQAKCYWLNFFQKNLGSRENHFTTVKEYFTEIESSEKNYEEQIRATIRDVQPDLIHSIGPINIIAKKIAEELGIPCLIGYEDRENLSEFTARKLDTTYEYAISDLMEDVYRQPDDNGKIKYSTFINLALTLSQKSPSMSYVINVS